MSDSFRHRSLTIDLKKSTSISIPGRCNFVEIEKQFWPSRQNPTLCRQKVIHFVVVPLSQQYFRESASLCLDED